MPFVEEELWKNPGYPGMIVVTASASILEDGRLFMEHGNASEAARRIPGIEHECAQQILARGSDGIYGFLPVRPSRPKDKIIGFGIFQVWREWQECADPLIIQHSMDCLRQYVKANTGLRVRMNFPELSEADLPAEEISALLKPVPPTVIICHNGEVAPQTRMAVSGSKELFLLVERWVMEGRQQMAVEYLMNNGYDRDLAQDQVAAVQYDIRMRGQQDALRRQRRANQLAFWMDSRAAGNESQPAQRDQNAYVG